VTLAYRVVSAKEALLNTTNLRENINAQASAIVKATLAKYTYDQLRGETVEIQDRLRDLLQPKVDALGVAIMSVSLNELNYHPSVANAMLRRQAAQALVEARTFVVQGAVGIALQAVRLLEQEGIAMSDSEKFQLAEKLLIVTCSDRDPTPTLAVA